VADPVHASAPPWWIPPAAQLLRKLPALRRPALNWLPWRTTNPFWASIETAGRSTFYCELQDRICSEVCFTGQYEPQETAIISRILRPSMTFVDVGAHWGYFTLLGAHRVGASGRVISMEPDPRLFRKLAGNITANGLKNVTALPLAALDRNATLVLKGHQENHASPTAPAAPAADRASEFEFVVPGEAIDNLLDRSGVNRIDLLKMDIEGAETLALRGMVRGLKENRYRALLLELHHGILSERGDDSLPLLDLLIECGYRAWWIDHSDAMTRHVAYQPRTDGRSYVHPLDLSRKFEDRVFLLWLARGEEFA